MPFEPMDFEPIRAGQEPLRRVFSDEYAFVIPTYQRPYAWETEQAEALLDDVLGALEEAQSTSDPVTYFLGSIVLIKQPGSPDAKVVDGQQRLTTLTILLAILRDLSKADAAASRHRFICEEGDSDIGTKSRYRLSLRKRDEEFFRDQIQTKGATAALPSTKGLTDARLRIIENADLFRKRLSERPDEERNDLIAFLLQRCYLVVIAVANVDMAHRVFTVLNARGLDLTATDILKADLLDRLPAGEEASTSERWEGLEEQIGRQSFVELFQHIRMISQREKPRERLEVGFPKFVTAFANPQDFMKNVLQPYGEAYMRLKSPASFAILYGAEAAKRLRYLLELDNNDWFPVAIKYFADLKMDQATLFLRRLETLAYFLFVTRAGINERIARYATVLKEMADGKWSGGAIDLTSDDQREFLRALDGPIYTMTRVRLPLLLRLDAELSSGGAEYEHDILSVEHVLPQNPYEGSEWLSMFPGQEERASWTNRLANLVLLTVRKNSQASEPLAKFIEGVIF